MNSIRRASVALPLKFRTSARFGTLLALRVPVVSALSDFKYSARSFARTPALTIGLVLTIAAGIGSNAIVLGFIRGLVTRDLPLPGIETVASVFARDEHDAFGPLSLD